MAAGQNAGSSASSLGEVDPYAVLGVRRSATAEEIRHAYRHLAHACHPDRHAQASLREAASAAFHRVQAAYEVLGDEHTRAVYDTYGIQGVRAGVQLTQRSDENLAEAFVREQAKQRQRQMEAKLNNRGSFLVGFSLAGLLDDSLPRTGTVGLQNMGMSSTTTFSLPTLAALAASDGVLGDETSSASTSTSDSAYVGAQAATKQGFGSGNLLCGLKHHESDGTSAEANASIGIRNSVSLTAWRPLTQHLVGSITHSFSQQDGYGLALLFSHEITQSIGSHLQWSIAPGVGVSSGLSYSGEKTYATGDVKLGALGTGISAQCVRQLGDSSLKLSGKFGTIGVDAEVGATKRVSELTSIGASMQAGLAGIFAKLRMSRGGQRFVVPILLAPVFRLRIAFAAAILPPLASYALNKLVLQPVIRKQRERKEIAMRKKRASTVRKAKEDANSTQAMLRVQSERKRKAESQAEDGLLIERALYGDLPQASFHNTDHETEDRTEFDETTEALPLPHLDVTIPLQMLVEKHQIQIEKDTVFADILGFCDPSPESDKKKLRVQYRYKNAVYECEVLDGEGICIPNPNEHHTLHQGKSDSDVLHHSR